ncbi:MAG: hypothetical protein J6O88_16280 [Chryseobacterium sp.]|uniref:hypothetical protein n=1 Tax=Chryseobacterium sp. TaxID=1871047 RepID=UPI001B06DFB9|nr:hypothetical protein [Chryseobacterium sp.]MBO6186217.1 hypothetical protein [Chryseobacterium sp.]
MKIKKMFLFVFIILSFFIIRIVSSKKASKDLINWNKNVYHKINSLNQKSILLHDRNLYSSGKKLPLTYDSANFDIDLMPIIVRDQILICQTHTIKVLWENSVYEYFCKEQIKSITYPAYEKDSLIMYVIKFPFDKRIDMIPKKDLIWVLEKIIFNDGKFFVEKVMNLAIPDTYVIRQLNTEVSYFNYSNNELDVVLTDLNNKSAIFSFDKSGNFLGKKYEGILIISKNNSENSLFYVVKKSKNDYELMKDDMRIISLGKQIVQGNFISDSMIEFYVVDNSGFGKFDFINGPYLSLRYSILYDLKTNNLNNIFFMKKKKKSFLFADKLRNDSILVIF